MKAGKNDRGRRQGEGEIGRTDSALDGRETTGGGQHPTSNIQHPTSKGQSARRDAVYDLEERLLAYAVRVVRVVDLLPKSRGADHLGGQLLRSGTSPALNHGELVVELGDAAKRAAVVPFGATLSDPDEGDGRVGCEAARQWQRALG